MVLILNKAKALKNNAVNDNLIINGNFDVWQRGLEFTSTGYSADRWFLLENGDIRAYRKLANNLDNSNYCLGIQTLSSDVSFFIIAQPIESEKIIPLRSKYVTLSFYIRCPSTNNWSGNLIAVAKSSSSINNVLNRSTISESTITITPTANDSWVKYSCSFLLPSDCTTLSIEFSPSANLSAFSSIDIAQVKLETGNFVTNFKSDPEDDKYNAKRFYQKISAKLKAGTGAGSSQNRIFGNAINLSEPLALNKPSIFVIENNNIGLSDISYNLINNNSAIEVFGRSNSPHSEINTQIVIDSEITYATKPNTPSIFNTERVSSGINLSWTSGLSYLGETIEYMILYGKQSQQLDNMLLSIDTSGFISGIALSDPFYCTISATSPFGTSNTSDLFFSNPLFSIPSGVTGVTGVWGTDQGIDTFKISWDYITNDGGSPLKRYLIHVSNNSGFLEQPEYGYGFVGASGYSLTVNPTANYRYIYRLRNIEVSGTDPYYVRVAGTNSAGIGVWSPTFTFNKTVPSPIRNLSTLAINSGITLSYLPPYGNGGTDISIVQVQHSLTSDFSAAVTKNYTPNYLPITVSGLTNNIGRWFRMRAISAMGSGDWSNYVSGVPNRTLTIPNSPINLSSSWVATSGIRLSFNAPSDDGGSPIINYTANIATNSGFTTNSNTYTTLNNNSTIDIPTPVYTGTYYLRAKANNSLGSSSYSTGISINSTTPEAPLIINTTPINSGFFISWSAPIGRGSLASSYAIERSSSTNFSSSITISNITGVNSYTVTGLLNNNIVYARIKGVNINGTGNNSSYVAVTPTAPLTVPSTGIIWAQRAEGASSYQRILPDNNYAYYGPKEFKIKIIPPTNLGGSSIRAVQIQSSMDMSFSSLTYSFSGLLSPTNSGPYVYELPNISIPASSVRFSDDVYASGHIFRVRFRNDTGFSDWGYGRTENFQKHPTNILFPYFGVPRWYNPTEQSSLLKSSNEWFFASGTSYSGSFDLFWPYPWDNGGNTEPIKFVISAAKVILENNRLSSLTDVIETTGTVYAATSGYYPIYLSSGLKYTYIPNTFGSGTYDFALQTRSSGSFPGLSDLPVPVKVNFSSKTLRLTNLGLSVPVPSGSPPKPKLPSPISFQIFGWGNYGVEPEYEPAAAPGGTVVPAIVGWQYVPNGIEPNVYEDPDAKWFSLAFMTYGGIGAGIGIRNVVGSRRSATSKLYYPESVYNNAFFQFSFGELRRVSYIDIYPIDQVGTSTQRISTDSSARLWYQNSAGTWVDAAKPNISMIGGRVTSVGFSSAILVSGFRLVSSGSSLTLQKIVFR